VRTIITALALSAMLTVEQRDQHRVHLAPPSAAVSAGGRYIAFTTFSKLAAADRDEARDVYVLDRRDHRVTLESAALQGSAEGSHPVMSGDGRFLLYETAGAVMFRDRNEDAIRSLGNGRQPSISADGTTVVFTSDVSGRISVYDVQTGGLSSIGASGAGASPAVSAEGRYIAFSANRSVFIHDRHANFTKQIAAGWDPAISADGRHVAYVSYVSPNRTLYNVFVADRETGRTQLVSRTRKGRPANGASANPAISADGQVVAFQSDASNLLPAKTSISSGMSSSSIERRTP